MNRTLSLLLLSGAISLPLSAQSFETVKLEQPPNYGSQVGVNPSEFIYYSQEWVFVDLFRSSADWVSQQHFGGPWDDGRSLNLNADGYPTRLAADQAAATVMASGMAPHYPGGRYVCLYDGQGELDFNWDASVARSQPGRIEVDVTPSTGILLRILRTNTGDPVRNIRFIMPGFESTYAQKPFHPRFLASWQYLRAFRFMDWQRTNSTFQSAWADRVAPSYYTQGGEEGMAVELMIDLCNELGTDAWFCMPHLCTDNYVTQFARLVKNRLRPDLEAYVEYSNECWNNVFVQSRYCQEMGVRLNLSNDPYEAQLRYYSQRSVEVFSLWASEFGGTDRIVRVLAGQNVNTWSAGVIMDWRNAHQSADVWGVNAYFAHDLGDPTQQIRVQNLTPQQILAEARMLLTPAINFSAQQELEARMRGLQMVAFEGGQHLVGWGSAASNTRLAAKFTAANRLPAMRQLYEFFLQEWRRIGGGLCCLYNSTSKYAIYGSWGLLESSVQPLWMSPKYMGVISHIAAYRYR